MDRGLHIVPCNSIHMMFMRFPIDVVFLKQNGHIVKIRENVRPWSMVGPVRQAYSVLELPSGSAQKYALQNGQLVSWVK